MTFIALVPPVYTNVKQYGALGDGVTDDTAAIAAARAAVNSAGGGVVFYPAGTYITGNQTLYSNVTEMGAGIDVTILQLKNNANTDLFSAYASSINGALAWNAGATTGIFNFRICHMTLDGNKANQTGTSYVLQFYGYDFILDYMCCRNGLSGNLRYDFNAPTVGNRIESKIMNSWFTLSNGIGIQAFGRSDQQWSNIVSGNNLGHAIHIGPNMGSLQCLNVHAWQPDGNANIPWLIETTCTLSNCSAESSNTVQVVILANKVNWNGGEVFSGGTSTAGAGIQIGQQAGLTPYAQCINQAAGVTIAVAPNNYTINTMLFAITGANGNIWFANDGTGRVVCQCDNTGAATYTGTPSGQTVLDISTIGATPDGTVGKSSTYNHRSSAYFGFRVGSIAHDMMTVDSTDNYIQFTNAVTLSGYSGNYTGLVWLIDTLHGSITLSGNIAIGQSATAQALASAGTITTANIGAARVAPTAAVTGVILAVGTIAGQQVTVINESAFSVTFAASGTSHVADGVSAVIAANRQMDFTWNSSTSLWYHS